jgi:superoxide dismutase, Cu-Zn family
MTRLAICAVSFAALAGCMTGRPEVADEDLAPVGMTAANADLRDRIGRSMGSATASQVGDSVRLTVSGINLPGGAHGLHIHTTGICAAPDFNSAGPHWNPTNQRHGKNNPAGMHRGDLPNLLIGTDGRGSIEYTIPSATLAGGRGALLDADGAAIVVHAQADDYRTDPSGNSGARIACGVLR